MKELWRTYKQDLQSNNIALGAPSLPNAAYIMFFMSLKLDTLEGFMFSL